LSNGPESIRNKHFWTPAPVSDPDPGFAGVTPNKKPLGKSKRLFVLINLGGVLLSHVVPHAVPSALKSLTSVFGMGTGVSSSPSPPKTV
jgi:hypothetical protein